MKHYIMKPQTTITGSSDASITFSCVCLKEIKRGHPGKKLSSKKTSRKTKR